MLTKAQEIKVLVLINFYEYTLGLFVGILLDLLLNYILPYDKNINIVLSIMISILLIVVITTTLLYFRVHSIEYLPILKDMELKKQENFSHPPPLAFAFAFWQTQKQLKLRNSILYDKMSFLFKKK